MTRIILHKHGYPPQTIRKRKGRYEYLSHLDAYGRDHWKWLPQSNRFIEAQIELYGETTPDYAPVELDQDDEV